MPVRAIPDPTPVPNLTFHNLGVVQRKHDVWAEDIYALELDNEIVPVPFSQFFLSMDKVLCRYWPQKTNPVDQYVIPDIYIPVVIKICS